MSLVGCKAAYVFFDATERLDLRQAFLHYWGRAGLSDITQFAAGMRPAKCQCHILRQTLEQAVIACVSVHLQGAAEALQSLVCILA